MSMTQHSPHWYQREKAKCRRQLRAAANQREAERVRERLEQLEHLQRMEALQ